MRIRSLLKDDGIKLLGGNTMKRISLAFILAVLVLGNYALAQTPDESTPSEEVECDGLSGAAYGLCNAYCEALDCDLDTGYDQHPKACDRVLGNYQKKTDFPGPPCDCGNICEDEAQDCRDRCKLEDVECQNSCCNSLQDCKKDCCDQDREIITALCIENCDGDEECIKRECESVVKACLIELCPIYK